MKKFIVIISLILFSLLTACTRQVGWVVMNYGNSYEASYLLFDGQETEKFQIDAGENLKLSYDVEVDEGALTMRLTDPTGNVVWEETFLEDAQDVFDHISNASGRYTLKMIGDNNKGAFDLQWEITD
jgi:hypothetical protein